MAIRDFGVGILPNEPGAYHHCWPIVLFLRHFKDKGNAGRAIETDEDWKAVIYSWGGPLPRFIDRVELRHDPEDQVVRIVYWETEDVKRLRQTQGLRDGE